jgi:hypothetical protein
MPTRSRASALPLLMLLCLAGACYPAMKLTKNDADVVLSTHTIGAPDPSVAGPYSVLRLSYGSGTDKNRAIYRDEVAWRMARLHVDCKQVNMQSCGGKVPRTPFNT